jgi:glucans biosynthesis protein C
MFAAGVSAARGGWLQGVQLELGLQRLRVVLPIGFVVWLIILREGMSQGNWAAFSGGWRWQSLVFSAWESFTCVALCVSLLVIFRQRWNAQGRMAKFLSDNAFAVYVFHPPILILIARIMVRLQWPPLVKAVMLSFLAAGGSFALSSLLFRRIPGLRSIL